MKDMQNSLFWCKFTKYMSKICLHGQKLQQGSIGSVVNRGWGRRLGNKGIMVKLRIVVYY